MPLLYRLELEERGGVILLTIGSQPRVVLSSIKRARAGRRQRVKTERRGVLLLTPRLFVFLGVTTEGASRRELSQLVAHHLVCDKNRDVLSTVVNCNSVAYHNRHDSRRPRPGCYNPLFSFLIKLFHFF